jgi:formylmethanofuran dehydrogenase subunit E
MDAGIDFFDAKAPHWEAACYPPQVRWRLEALISSFGLKAGDRVLDIGTGPGILLPYIQARIGPLGRITAVDRSLPMVRQADPKRRWFRDLVLQGDVHRLPFGDRCFDVIICFAAFPHFHRPERAMSEMARVAAPGGRVVVAHLMSREELAVHHGSHPAVRGHGLPPQARMMTLMRKAGLAPAPITDLPGRYLAWGRRYHNLQKRMTKGDTDMTAEEILASQAFKRCEAFHGHVCPGLALGYRSARLAMDHLKTTRAADEEVVAIVETDACSADAVQVLTGCTFGKGNFIFKDHGKMALTLFKRDSGRGVRVALKPGAFQPDAEHMDLIGKIAADTATEAERERFQVLHRRRTCEVLEAAADDLFAITPVNETLPPKAKIQPSRNCARCGEPTMPAKMASMDGERVCRGCCV